MTRTPISEYNRKDGTHVRASVQNRRSGKGTGGRPTTHPSTPSLKNKPGVYKALPPKREKTLKPEYHRLAAGTGVTAVGGLIAVNAGHALVGFFILLGAAFLLVATILSAITEVLGGKPMVKRRRRRTIRSRVKSRVKRGVKRRLGPKTVGRIQR